MVEESLSLTHPEAEFCYRISRLTARVTEGSDVEGKMEALCLRISAELRKPAGFTVSLSAEEKNALTVAMTAYQLLVREKCNVFKKHFYLQDIPVSTAEIKESLEEISSFVLEQKVNLPALQKRIRFRNKAPARKLYVADLHFFHDNLNAHMDRRGFSGYEEMNAHMIRQWNDYVTPKDEIYILGDFAISRGKNVNEVLRQLNGKKYLIEGNHDKYLEDKDFDRSLFEWVRPYAEIMDSKRRVILSHYPVFCYRGQYRTTAKGEPLTYMLYGHVHNTHDEKLVNEFIRITRATSVVSKYHQHAHPIPCNMINCFCMFSDYIPLTLDDWISLDARRREEMSLIFQGKESCCLPPPAEATFPRQ